MTLKPDHPTVALKAILALAGLKPVSAMAAGDVFFIEFASEKAARKTHEIFSKNGFNMKLERIPHKPLSVWMLTGRKG